MTAAFLAGTAAGYGIALPVGAVGAYLVSLGARHSWRIGGSAALGVASADGIYAALAMVGGGALAQVIEPAVGPLRVASAMVLLIVAAISARRAVVELRHRTDQAAVDVPVMGAASSYVRLLAITLLNPVTVVYFAALVVGTNWSAGATVVDRLAFVAGVFLASASWQLFLAGGGAVAGRALTGRRARAVTSLVSAAVIAGLAVRLL